MNTQDQNAPLKVLAAPGLSVPLESNPRRYITDTPPEGEEAYSVPDTAYYHRRIIEGDLIDTSVTKVSKKGAK